MKIQEDKFLIVEIGSHYKIVDNLFKLVEGKCDLIINSHYLSEEILTDFPFLKYSTILYSDFGFYDWLKTIFLSKKYRKIIISTGAEESYPPLLFFYLIFMFFFGSKTTLCIRNNKNYMKKTDLSSFLRFYFLRFIKVLAFETKSQREFMSNYVTLKNEKVVLYDRYPTFDSSNRGSTVHLRSLKFNEKIRIGLLGSWDVERRDYELILDILSSFPIEERSKFELVALGNVNRSLNQSLIERFLNLTNLIYRDGYVSENDFFEQGDNCSVLLSPLKPNKGYGFESGSGSIGDAIYLKKFLIIPSFFDKGNEFGEQLLKYDSNQDLYQILFDLSNNHVFSTKIDYSKYLIDTIRTDFYVHWRNV